MAKIDKAQSSGPTAVAGPIIEAVTEHVFPSEPVSDFPCRVCSAPGATASSDGLCWICRRLKVSAWQGTGNNDAASE